MRLRALIPAGGGYGLCSHIVVLLAGGALVLVAGCGGAGEVGGPTAAAGEVRGIAASGGRGTADEVPCPAATCDELASRRHDVLSCHGGKLLVRCAAGQPRCYACAAGHACTFDNGGQLEDDYCAPETCTPCNATARRTGATWGCEEGQGRLVRCVDGCLQTEPCAAGCTYDNGGAGQDDFCEGACRPCNATARRTGATWGCDERNSRLVRCVGGCMEAQACAEGCTYNNGGAGNDDFCQRGSATQGAPAGHGITGGCQWLQRWQVEALLRWAGFPEWSIPEMTRIAWCESQYYTCAVSTRSANPNQDWGLLQISVDNWLFAGERFSDLLDPWTNVSRAKYVFDLQGLGAWACHYL